MNDTFIDFQVKQYSQAYIYLKAELVTLIGFWSQNCLYLMITISIPS